jgi:hypothetical protein
LTWCSRCVLVFSFLILISCGYVGPVVPPSPLIPQPVSDLSVIERGDQLVVSFTAPSETTDKVDIKELSNIEMRVDTKIYQVPTAEGPVTFHIPAADWIGESVAVAVRSSVKQNKNFSEWSKPLTLQVIPPLQPPDFSIQATAQGYKLTWADEGSGVRYDVLRKGPADSRFIVIGTADKPEYVDGAAQWATTYAYAVQARTESAESLVATAQTVSHPDEFPPAVPSGLAGVAGVDAIELSWERDKEADLKGYFVYRSSDGTSFQKTGDLLILPAYSDHAVEHGKKYWYRVSAIDQAGNESAPSAATSIVFP